MQKDNVVCELFPDNGLLHQRCRLTRNERLPPWAVLLFTLNFSLVFGLHVLTSLH